MADDLVRPVEPAYRRLARNLLSAAGDLASVLEAGGAGDLDPRWAKMHLGQIRSARAALDAAEGLIYLEWERQERRRPLTWEEIGRERGTTRQAAQERGARLMGEVRAELERMHAAAESGAPVLLTDLEADHVWPVDEPPSNVRTIALERLSTGEKVVPREDRPSWWHKMQITGRLS